jgi:outer membrane protein assembly factor BamE (lipoprotein component of BamABCDE complex)
MLKSFSKPILSFVAALFIAGCASFDGRGLVPGQSREADVVATMGTPALTLERPGGGRLLYFSRLPYGREIYKAAIGPDGTLQSLEQTLTAANIRGLQVDTTTRDQVRERLGPPYRITRAPFKPLEVWEYPWRIVEDRRILWLSFSDDGVLREFIEMHDFQSDPASGRGGKSR